jgi:hypothetical protein
MMFLGVFKRIVPFFLTFAAGLFIASFFINISSPSFNFPRKSHKFREMQRLRDENRDLRRSNEELRRQLEEARRNAELKLTIDSDFPNFEPPPPPPAPRVVLPKYER